MLFFLGVAIFFFGTFLIKGGLWAMEQLPQGKPLEGLNGGPSPTVWGQLILPALAGTLAAMYVALYGAYVAFPLSELVYRVYCFEKCTDSDEPPPSQPLCVTV